MLAEGTRSVDEGGDSVDNKDRLENEIFITKVRWLTIIGVPVVLWFYDYNLSYQMLSVTGFFALYNWFLQVYFLKKDDVSKYTNIFSVIDIIYLTYIYVFSLSRLDGLPQLFYFL
ncbi:MAG: hypothetical protein ACYC21_14800, partial [Eubacteriales bacterium]